jgi:hypothetical protein
MLFVILKFVDLYSIDGRHPCLDTALDEAGMTHLQELSLEIKLTSQKALKGR